ncbi:MAG: hypothetical protein ACI94Y_001798 [Maribacter sp.]|jgi:hypothetical protein
MKTTQIFILLSLLIIGIGCKENKPLIEEKDDLQMIHISHTRGADNSVDSVIGAIDYSSYDLRLLGGDLANFTSVDALTIASWDDVFDFGDPKTLWALGNHDYTNVSLVSEYTGREPFYSYHKEGITFLVLDTQEGLSNINGEQLDFINNVVDTISDSKYLILLHHKLIWMYGHPELEPMIGGVANGVFGNCFACTNPNNFYQEVYPLLVEVENKGIEVICIGGDIGFHIKKFEYLTTDGVQYLASGCNLIGEDSVLVFDYFVDEKELDWRFRGLSEL